MLDVSAVMGSPNFSQPFSVTRSSGGTWTNGFFSGSTASLQFNGIITPMSTEDMDQLPTGDRITGGINVYSTQQIYTTNLNEGTGNTGAISDQITWKGENWKVLTVKNFSDYGYYKAVCTKLLGAA